MREAAAAELRNVIPRAEDSCSLALGTGGDTADGGDTCWTARHVCRVLGWAGLAAAYNAYLGYALHLHRATGRDLDWCGGLGFLLLVTLLVYTGLRAANGTFLVRGKGPYLVDNIYIYLLQGLLLVVESSNLHITNRRL